VTPLAWLFLLAGLVSLDVRMMPAILPAIAASLGATAGETGLSMTAYTVSYGLMQVVYGPLSDRYGRIRIIRAAALLFAVGTLVSGLAADLWDFVGARLVTGMFAAAIIPTTFVYIGDTVHYAQRQKVVGRFASVFSAAQALSATIAGTVTHFVSWRILFYAYAVLTIVTVAAMRRTPEAARTASGAPLRYADILRIGRAVRVYVAAFVEGFLLWGGSTYMGVLASQRFGWNDLQVGALIACYGGGTVVGALALGRLTAVLDERRLASWGGLAQLAGFGLLALPLPWPFFALGLASIGLGLATLHSTLQTRGTELAPTARGKSFSLFALAFFVGGSVGTAVFGRMIDHGLITLAMTICGVGLGIVGQLVAREQPAR
jgi:predicted MFS family arabinose efflux permease